MLGVERPHCVFEFEMERADLLEGKFATCPECGYEKVGVNDLSQ